MPVYVDPLRQWGHGPSCFRGGSCHLMADSLEELEAFARSIGLKPEWLQQSQQGIVHYDLTRRRREDAIRKGAVPVDGQDFLHLVRRLKCQSQSLSTLRPTRP